VLSIYEVATALCRLTCIPCANARQRLRGRYCTPFLAALSASKCQKRVDKLERQLQADKEERRTLFEQLLPAKRMAALSRNQ